jgi:DNA-directed RNA polymerase specialized sigma24 family protein
MATKTPKPTEDIKGTSQVAKKPIKVRKERSTNTRKHYVTNAQLIEAIAADKANGMKLSNKLAGYLHMIVERYSYSPSFAGYSFREDMVSLAVLNLCANWHKFDPAKSDNPFAFYTTAAYRSFLQYLADEKKHREIRDNLLVEAGANPSFNFQEKSRAGVSHDDTAFRGSNSGE